MGVNERSETAFDEGVQALENTGTENPDVGKRDSDQAAISSGVQPEPSGALNKLRGRPDRAACALSWLAAAAAGGMSFGEWRPSIRSLFLFARAPENEDEKTGGPASLRESGAMPGQVPFIVKIVDETTK